MVLLEEASYVGEDRERCLFKNKESAERISERQNWIFIETFSRPRDSEQSYENQCNESFLAMSA